MKSHENYNPSTKAYILAILLFSMIPAFYVWNNPFYTLLPYIIALIILLDIIQHSGSLDSRSNLNALFLGLVLFYFFLINGYTFIGFVTKLCVLPILFARRQLLKETLHAFTNTYALLMSMSLCVYFLVILFGINLPHRVLPPFNEIKTYSYLVYPFMVTPDSVNLLGANFRFMGMFDEPGVVGTISAVLLIIDRFDLKKKRNVVLLISGLFSFSLFFYLICFFSIFIYSPFKIKVGVVFLIGVLVFVLRDNDVVNALIFSRFSMENGMITFVDNRNTTLFNDVYEQFKQSSAYWTGMGVGSSMKVGEGGSSYKMLVMDYGMLFFVVYLISFYMIIFRIYKNWKCYLAFSIILLGIMYQRPFVGEITFTFLVLSASVLIPEKYYV